VGVLDGKRVTFCCPACALSEGKQLGKPVRVTALTDFPTDEEIDPERAFLVKGSDVNPCAQHAATPLSDKRPMQVAFDRCSPSLLAFSSRSAAEAFARDHGGTILTWKDAATLPLQSSAQ
jgi:nitrous oxide reductase accessory protein NosL